MASSKLSCNSNSTKKHSECYSWAEKMLSEGDEWVQSHRLDFYDGCLERLNENDSLDLKFQIGISSPYPITKITTLSRFVFSRSWNHISGDNKNLFEIRYVKRGHFTLVQMGKTINVGPGQFAFSKLKVPFRWELTKPDPVSSEYYFILLPPEISQTYLQDGIPLNTSLSAKPDKRLAMPALFELLYSQGSYLDIETRNQLISVLVKEAAVVAHQQNAVGERRITLAEAKTEEILSYINLNLSNPDLSTSLVASSCNISTRYLCLLLNLKGTSFTSLVWGSRLKKSAEALLNYDTKVYPISDIAYLAGFKSAPHFSRLFKKHFGCTPKEYRLKERSFKNCIEIKTVN